MSEQESPVRTTHLNDLGCPLVRSESEHGTLPAIDVVGAEFACLVDADNLVDDLTLPRRKLGRLGRRADLLGGERRGALWLGQVRRRRLRLVGVRYFGVGARRCAGDENGRRSVR